MTVKQTSQNMEIGWRALKNVDLLIGNVDWLRRTTDWLRVFHNLVKNSQRITADRWADWTRQSTINPVSLPRQ